jgi:GntR family transcriptional regulator
MATLGTMVAMSRYGSRDQRGYRTTVDPIVIDVRSPVPSYRQLAEQLRRRIESGEIGKDEPLPSITRLQQETGLAVKTIRAGIALLVDDGLVYTVPGRGTFAR